VYKMQLDFENDDVHSRFFSHLLAMSDGKGITITIPGIRSAKTTYEEYWHERIMHHDFPSDLWLSRGLKDFGEDVWKSALQNSGVVSNEPPTQPAVKVPTLEDDGAANQHDANIPLCVHCQRMIDLMCDGDRCSTPERFVKRHTVV
jgi:hypothetical protein